MRVEEVSVFDYYVVKQVMQHYVVFDSPRTLVKIFVFPGDRLQSVICPVVGKMMID
jgi:hypothetical protein